MPNPKPIPDEVLDALVENPYSGDFVDSEEVILTLARELRACRDFITVYVRRCESRLADDVPSEWREFLEYDASFARTLLPEPPDA